MYRLLYIIDGYDYIFVVNGIAISTSSTMMAMTGYLRDNADDKPLNFMIAYNLGGSSILWQKYLS